MRTNRKWLYTEVVVFITKTSVKRSDSTSYGPYYEVSTYDGNGKRRYLCCLGALRRERSDEEVADARKDALHFLWSFNNVIASRIGVDTAEFQKYFDEATDRQLVLLADLLRPVLAKKNSQLPRTNTRKKAGVQ